MTCLKIFSDKCQGEQICALDKFRMIYKLEMSFLANISSETENFDKIPISASLNVFLASED